MIRLPMHGALWAIALVLCTAGCPRRDKADLKPDVTSIDLTLAQGESQSVEVAFAGLASSVGVTGTPTEVWLSSEASVEAGRSALTVTVSAAGLEQGFYEAQLRLSAPAHMSMTLPVTLLVGPPEIRFEPVTLAIDLRQEEVVAQEIAVAATIAGTPVTLESDSDWLIVGEIDAASGTVTLEAAATGLSVAAYAGNVRARAVGFEEAVLPVTLNVTGDCIKTLVLDLKSTSRLDLGWTGNAFEILVPEGRISLRATCPDGVPCGEDCSIDGILDNAVIAGNSTNRRCTENTFIQCQSDGDCAGAGVCRYLLPPMNLDIGSAVGCATPYFESSLSGSFNATLGTGSVSAMTLVAKAFIRPCSYCRNSVCENTGSAAVFAQRLGLPCVVHGTSLWGDTSWDCPAGVTAEETLPVHLPAMTVNAQASWTLSSNHIACQADLSKKCFCSTCNNSDRDACSTHSDCPVSGRCEAGVNQYFACTVDADCPGSACVGRPCTLDSQCRSGDMCLNGSCSTPAGLCGGKTCLDEGNTFGAPCNAATTCSSGQCGVQGAVVAPSRCIGDPGFEGCGSSASIDRCLQDPLVHQCSVSTHMSCGVDGDCPAGEVCSTDFAKCWTDNGVIGASISTELSVSSAVQEPSFGALFCARALSSDSASQGIGLPGPARLRLYTNAELHD